MLSTLICTNCEKIFEYPNKEFNRRSRKGITQFFCGLSCACSYRNKNRSPELQAKMTKNFLELVKEKNKNNNYSRKGKFTYYLNKSRNRLELKNLEKSDLTEEYLNSIWTGYCALSKIPIKLYIKTKDVKRKISLSDASLDRIDSSKGYIKGNVQFVALGINYAKNSFSNDELKEFLFSIKEHLFFL